MNTQWYVVKVLPGKERKITEHFNKEISLGNIKNIERFICPLEKEYIQVKNKKVIREKVLYSGYLYFETERRLEIDELKFISTFPEIMSMGGDKTPICLSETDIRRILKDETLDSHIKSKTSKYSVGDHVIIIDGPFKDFNAIISEINDEKIILEVKIFGRSTTVNLVSSQIKRIV